MSGVILIATIYVAVSLSILLAGLVTYLACHDDDRATPEDFKQVLWIIRCSPVWPLLLRDFIRRIAADMRKYR